MNKDSLLGRALKYHQEGNLNKARTGYESFLQNNPNDADALHLLGMIAEEDGDRTKAINLIHEAIKNNDSCEVYHNNLGTIYELNGEMNLAEQQYNLAIKINNHCADALNNLGHIYTHKNLLEDARVVLLRAVEIDNSHLQAHYNLAKVYQLTYDIDLSIHHYLIVLKLDHNYLSAYINLGILLYSQRKLNDAINCFNYVITANPHHVLGHYNLGITLYSLGDTKKSKFHLEKSLKLKENHTKSMRKLALIAESENDHSNFFNYLEKAIQIEKENINLICWHAISLLATGQWAYFKQSKKTFLLLYEEILQKNGMSILESMPSHHMIDDLSKRKKIAEIYSKHLSVVRPFLFTYNRSTKKQKYRIGYVSDGFGLKSSGYFFQDSISTYDDEKFEIYYFDTSNSPEEPNDEIKDKANYFINLNELSYYDAAKKINDCEIDILINLSNDSDFSWPQIFAAKPAPIQCCYLGDLNTQGGNDYDYLISSEIIIPNEYHQYYTEKIIYLDNTPFSIKKENKIYSKNNTLRKSYGLTESQFIFSCFNQSSIITEEVIDCWVTILNKTPSSILLLANKGSLFESNIRDFFKEKQIDSSRLFFFDNNELFDSEPHQLANVMLDTFLKTGTRHTLMSARHHIPTITLLGNTPESRVGAGINHGLNQTNLNAKSPDEYILLAVDLFKNKNNYNNQIALFEKENIPLFDTKSWMKNLESLYLSLLTTESL